jgi:hypothetical protein
MKITVSPQWSFVEAVDAAWQAYPGGLQFGAPNRIRVLEQWANVVGRERAVAELQSTLASYSNPDKAATELGLSSYALKKLRRSFAAMPAITPHAPPPKTLTEFLRRLPELEKEPEISLTVHAVPRFAGFLGYSESEIYFELAVPGEAPLRADAVLAPAGPGHPYLVLNLKGGKLDPQALEEAIALTDRCREALRAAFGVLITPRNLAVLSKEGRGIYPLQHFTDRASAALISMLGRPAKIKTPKTEVSAPAGAQLREMLEWVATANTNDEKKKSLEVLASKTFEVHEFLRCKYRNLRTRSSELDIVCEVVGPTTGFLIEYGRYFFVECKNWSAPAGAKEIRDFLGKLRKSRVRLGVYFSRNGITGEQQGTDALREIHSAYDQDGVCVVVISGQELSRLNNLADVLPLIDQKLDALRFDF